MSKGEVSRHSPHVGPYSAKAKDKGYGDKDMAADTEEEESTGEEPHHEEHHELVCYSNKTDQEEDGDVDDSGDEDFKEM